MRTLGGQNGGNRHSTMKRNSKDRLGDALLILLFLAVVGGIGYWIFKIMTRWKVKGLG
jgi:hypothetical protein